MNRKYQAPVLTSCPLCGAPNITRVVAIYHAHTPKGVVKIPRVPRYQCSACGEQLLDVEACRLIDDTLAAQRARRKKTS